MYELLGSYMFRHQIWHLQGARSVTLPNYIYTNAILTKIKKNIQSKIVQFDEIFV